MWFTPNPAAPSDGKPYRVDRFEGPSPFSGEDPVGDVEAQAFLVAASHETEIGVHFHVVDQFQYFVGGSGEFGPHPVGPGVVHYSDRLRPYGPIQPSEEGISFLTLRGVSDAGAHHMPASREELQERRSSDQTPARNVSFDLANIELAGSGSWQLLVDDPDGLQIALAGADDGAMIDTWDSEHTSSFAIVVAGGLVEGEDRLSAGSFRHLGHGDGLKGLISSEAGTRLAVLCLPG